jgi:hypothetical protein
LPTLLPSEPRRRTSSSTTSGIPSFSLSFPVLLAHWSIESHNLLFFFNHRLHMELVDGSFYSLIFRHRPPLLPNRLPLAGTKTLPVVTAGRRSREQPQRSDRVVYSLVVGFIAMADTTAAVAAAARWLSASSSSRCRSPSREEPSSPFTSMTPDVALSTVQSSAGKASALWPSRSSVLLAVVSWASSSSAHLSAA